VCVCVEGGSEWGREVRRWGLMGGAERMGFSVCPEEDSAVSLFFLRCTWGTLLDHPRPPRPVLFLPTSPTHPTHMYSTPPTLLSFRWNPLSYGGVRGRAAGGAREC
jgi:hypothetical protein